MTNPFEISDSQPEVGLPSGKRPVSATVFGILNLVFGIMGICGGIFTVGMLAVVVMPDFAEMFEDNPGMDQFKDPAFRTFLLVQTILSLGLTVLLIISGIGLLKFKPWGRTTAIWYAIPTILVVIGSTIGQYVLVVMPALARAAEGPERLSAIGGLVGGIFGALFGLLYPVLLLIFMNRRSFREQIGG